MKKYLTFILNLMNFSTDVIINESFSSNFNKNIESTLLENLNESEINELIDTLLEKRKIKTTQEKLYSDYIFYKKYFYLNKYILLLIIAIIDGWSIMNNIICNYFNSYVYMFHFIFTFISFIPSIFANSNLTKFSFKNHLIVLLLNNLLFVYLLINNIIVITVTKNSPILVSLEFFNVGSSLPIMVYTLNYYNIINIFKRVDINKELEKEKFLE